MGNTPKSVEVSQTAERDQATRHADPFPPEGTDEKTLPGAPGQKPLSEADRVAATRAVIKGHAIIKGKDKPH